jgi:hypothetical protein
VQLAIITAVNYARETVTSRTQSYKIARFASQQLRLAVERLQHDALTNNNIARTMHHGQFRLVLREEHECNGWDVHLPWIGIVGLSFSITILEIGDWQSIIDQNDRQHPLFRPG